MLLKARIGDDECRERRQPQSNTSIKIGTIGRVGRCLRRMRLVLHDNGLQHRAPEPGGAHAHALKVANTSAAANVWTRLLFCGQSLRAAYSGPISLGIVSRRAINGQASHRETDMTILQGSGPGSTSGDSPPRLLAKGEPRARVAGLSAAKRHALVACLNANGLTKKSGA